MRQTSSFEAQAFNSPYLKIRERKRELYFAGAGLCGVTLYYLLENIALTYTFASNVGVIVSVAPFFTAFLAHFFLDGEKLTARFFLGFAVALAGIFIISFDGSARLQLNPLGDLLTVLAAAVWGAYSVLTKKISAFGYNTIQSTRRIFSYGLLFMLPTLPFLGFSLDIGRMFEAANLFNLLFLGVGASALCFVTWNFALKVLGAVKTSAYIYAGPVITVFTSMIVLHERLTGAAGVGILLTLTGLLASQIKVFSKANTGAERER